MIQISKLGSDEGPVTGPRPGDGASSVGGMVVGGSDMEGTPGDALPSRYRHESAGRDASGVTPPADPGTYAVGPPVGQSTWPWSWQAAGILIVLALLALWLLMAFAT